MRTGGIEVLWRDMLYALRMLLRNPGFTVVAVVTLALGVGANTAIFSVVNAALLTPVPILQPDRVVFVVTDNAARGWDGFPASIPDYMDWKAGGAFESLAASVESGFNIRIGVQAERVPGLSVTPEWFRIQHVSPSLGRVFGQSEIQPGHENVAVLTYALWKARFAGDSTVIGSHIVINDAQYEIIGVLPAKLMRVGQEEIFTPLVFREPEASERNYRLLGVLGRIQSGLDLSAAQARMTDLSKRLANQYPNQDAGNTARLQPVKDVFVQDVKTLLLMLLGAVGFVLLVACANIANLLLVRGTARQREMAIRAALGASRMRLMSLLICESIILSVFGSVIGLIPAWSGIHLLTKLKLTQLPNPTLVSLNPVVLLFTFLLAVITGFIFGLIPAWQVRKASVSNPLKQRTETSGQHTYLGNLFVSLEVALTVILLAGAGLMLKGFIRLRTTDPGYEQHNVLTMRIALAGKDYDRPDKLDRFYHDLLAGMNLLPGVEAAGATNILPTSSDLEAYGLHFADRPEPKKRTDVPVALVDSVTPDYFRTLKIPLLHGRYLSDSDRSNTPPVAVVDESLAKQFWPSQDAVGKLIKTSRSEPFRTIVGVVGRIDQSVAAKVLKGKVGQLYLPFYQAEKPEMSLVVSSVVEPASLTSVVRKVVNSIDGNQPIFQVETLEAARSSAQAPIQLGTWLLGMFALLALLLAAVGVYGVISYSVEQRTQEIGVRMALGAQQLQVLGLVMKKGFLLIVVGVILGLAGAFALTRLINSLLNGINPNDPLIFSAATFVLVVVAIIATCIPSYRASRISPIVALRNE